MLTILYLDTWENWHQRMDRTKHDYIVAMALHPDITVFSTGPGFPDFISIKNSIIQHNPDLIIIDQNKTIPNWQYLKTCKIPVVKFWNETFDIKNTKREIIETGINLSIFHHPEAIKDFKDIFSETHKFRGLMHRINPKVFKDYREEKEYDILLTGHCSPDVYPLRNRFHKMITDGKFSKWKCEILNHPGYKVRNIDQQEALYATHLNKARITLGCSSKFRYPLSKYIEYPACGTLLAGDIPDYRPEFFREVGIEIDNSWSDEKIIQTINWWLENDVERIEKTQNAFNVIHRQCTTKQYVEQFLEILTETGLVKNANKNSNKIFDI